MTTGPKKLKVAPPPPPTFDDADGELLTVKRTTPTPAPENDAKRHDVIRQKFQDWLSNRAPDCSKRARFTYRFELDTLKFDDFALSIYLDKMRGQRQFLPVIRDALRLFQDLGQGKIDVLLELFPAVEDAFYRRFTAQKTDPDSSIADQLARLEALLLQAGNTPIDKPTGGPKPLNVPTIAGPVIDDETPKLKIRKAKSDGKSAQNFLSSAFALIGQ